MLRGHRIAAHWGLLAVVVWIVAGPAAALAIDRLSLVDGMDLNGDVQNVGRNEIAFRRVGGEVMNIPVNQVVSIRFGDEPPQLQLVRSPILEGNFEAAQRALANEAVNPERINARLEVKQEIQYFQALVDARLALAGNGDAAAAAQRMQNFLQANPGTWRYYEANELLGQLLLSTGQAAQAVRHFQVLEEAPWTDYKMRGGIARGWALVEQAQPDWSAAAQAFDSVLALAGNSADKLVVEQKLHAQVGKARCLAEQGQIEAAEKMLHEVVQQASPEQIRLMAAAYLALGHAYRKAGKTKDALLAFLHVDLLFNLPQYHAEALYHLGKLWSELNRPDRALEAQRLLQEKYQGSRWAKRQ
jgi:tetratricopeptide (TPR) repeat protein